MRWLEPHWRAEAETWIREQVRVTGPVEQPHVHPWSTVMRVPTADGVVWFKASAADLAYRTGGLARALAWLRYVRATAPGQRDPEDADSVPTGCACTWRRARSAPGSELTSARGVSGRRDR